MEFEQTQPWPPAAATPTKPAKPANYFVRHWRGDLPLAISYWINGALIGNAVSALLVGLSLRAQAKESRDLRLSAAAGLAGILVSGVIYTWATMGIWRSANQHVNRGGRGGWATLAKFMVLIGLLSVLAQLTRANIVGQAVELAKLSFGVDSLKPITVKVSADAKTVLLEGTMGLGSANEVKRVLASQSSVTVVAFHSGGGRILEARAIADEISRRKLNTYVEGVCMSACTIAFLAGQDRGATPNARVGFHRPSFAGRDDPMFVNNDQMMSVYRKAGVSEAFMTRVKETSSESMWYPTRDELLANHVTTRVSLGGETVSDFGGQVHSAADLRTTFLSVPLWRAMDKRFPGSLDRAAAAAWAVKQRGGTDDQVMSAGRAVVGGLLTQALATAPDERLEDFLALSQAELSAALALSPEACNKLLDGQLNITATLPREVVKQEMDVSEALYATPPRTELRPPSKESLQSAVRQALSALTPDQVEVARAPEKFRSQALRRCSSLLALQDSIAKLPITQRRLALRAMYQSPQ